MSESYDIFKNLDDICNGNIERKFDLKVSEDENSDEFDLDATTNVDSVRKSKPKAKSKAIKSVPSSPRKTSVDQLPNVLTLSGSPALESNEPLANKDNTQTNTVNNGRRTRSKSKRHQTEAEPPPLATIKNTPTVVQAAKLRRRNRKQKRTENNVVDTTNSIDLTSITAFLDQPTQPTTPTHIPTTNRDVMRARRNYIAEVAARCTTVDFVDLVTSPLPRIEGIVNVDSDIDDADVEAPSVENASNSFDMSFDEENPDISVKIIWNGKPEIFKLRKYQKFAAIFNELAVREKTDVANVVLNLNNKILTLNDTPASIDYKIYQFIGGRILMGNFNRAATNTITKKRDTSKIALKIQSDKWKRPLKVELNKTDKFKILYIKCAEELNIPHENIILSFDGDHLEYNATAAVFEFEGGEAIDLRVKK